MSWASETPTLIPKHSNNYGDAPLAAEYDIPQIYLYAPAYSEEIAAARREKFLTK